MTLTSPENKQIWGVVNVEIFKWDVDFGMVDEGLVKVGVKVRKWKEPQAAEFHEKIRSCVLRKLWLIQIDLAGHGE